jgi:formyl-CoA transferase
VGVTERLKIDYETLKKRNPRLIYCSVTSYGQSGPDAKLKGYDVVTQAASGLMNLTGFPDGPPTKAGSALADSLGGTFAFGGITTALLHRERTGKGQWVDVSMVDCLFSMVFDEPMDCYEKLELPARLGNRIMRLSPFNSYQTKDGWLVIGSGTDSHWHNVLRAIEREDLIGDQRFSDLSGRITRNEEVDTIISEWAKEQTSEEAMSKMRTFDVICGPVRTIQDILAWPHMKARNMLQDLPHPTLGPLSDIKAPGFPIKFSDSPGEFDQSAPLGGHHNEEILGGLLGIEKKEIEKLKSEGII